MSNFSTFFPAGGGGGTPVGGLAYFSVPDTETFTAGQEVYTDPGGMVWIKTQSELTSLGTGVLDSTQYPLVSRQAIATNSAATRYSTLARFWDARYNITFSGKHIFLKGYNGSVNEYMIYEPDGTLLEGPTTAPSPQTASANMFFNNTHTLMASPSGGNFGGSDSTNPSWNYLLTSTLTNYASYEATPIKTFAPPFSSYGASATVTNPGGSNERHWFWHGGTSTNSILRECTFDPTVASGSTAWTATGNTITLNPNITTYQYPKIVSNGNLIYVQYQKQLWTYNATTRELVDYVNPTFSWGDNQRTTGIGVIVIPASSSASGLAEFIFSQAQSTPTGSTKSIQLSYVHYFGTVVTAPNLLGEKILLTHQDKATTLDVENVTIANGAPIYLWQRIA